MKARPLGWVLVTLLPQNLCESSKPPLHLTPQPYPPAPPFLLRARTTLHSQETKDLLCLLGTCDCGLGSVFSSIQKKDFMASILGPLSYLPRSP